MSQTPFPTTPGLSAVGCISFEAGNDTFHSQIDVCIESVEAQDGDIVVNLMRENRSGAGSDGFYPNIDVEVTIDGPAARTKTKTFDPLGMIDDGPIGFSMTFSGVPDGDYEVCLDIPNRSDVEFDG